MIKNKFKITDGITNELLNFDISDSEIDLNKLQKELNNVGNNKNERNHFRGTST